MFGIEQKVAHTAKRAGLLSGGLLFCTVGIGFLTLAGWFALAPIVGIQNTALILAGAYLGIGFILVGAGAHREKDPQPRPEAPETTQPKTAPPIVEAFMYGLQAGANADRARR